MPGSTADGVPHEIRHLDVGTTRAADVDPQGGRGGGRRADRRGHPPPLPGRQALLGQQRPAGPADAPTARCSPSGRPSRTDPTARGPTDPPRKGRARGGQGRRPGRRRPRARRRGVAGRRRPPGGRHLGRAPGRSPLNVAIGLARLGRDTVLLTRLGEDARGRSVLRHLEASGVRLAAGSVLPVTTSTAAATLAADGSASYAFDLHWELGEAALPAAPRGGAHRVDRGGPGTRGLGRGGGPAELPGPHDHDVRPELPAGPHG